MSLIFKPSTGFYLSYVQGYRNPKKAYLLCGSLPQRYCVGVYDVAVTSDKTVSYVPSSFERVSICAPYDFDQLTFYDVKDPHKQLAYAETSLVRKGEVIQLDLLSSLTPPSYEDLLDRVISA